MSKHNRRIPLFSAVLILLIQVNLPGQLNTFTHNFEEGNLRGWTKKGTAFNNQPTLRDNSLARNRGYSNLQGQWWIGTFENYQGKPNQRPGDYQGDEPMGSLRSPDFTIPTGTLSFLIGGGNSPNLKVELVEVLGTGEFQSRVRFSATGKNSESMERVIWNLNAYAGKTGYLIIIDGASGSWGHINVDDFKFIPPSTPSIIKVDTFINVMTVQVPNLLNYTFQNAKSILANKGLTLGKVTEEESDQPKGIIINQFPPPNATVIINSKVDIVLAKPRIVIIPDLLNKTYEEASKLLSIRNLHINILGTMESELERGRIVAQTPKANTLVEVNSTVSVYTAVPIFVNVPDLYNHSVKDAAGILKSYRLNLGLVNEEESNMPVGNVIKQNPEPKTRVIIHSKVNIVIAKQTKTAVPNLIDKTIEEARSLLEESKLNIKIAGSRESKIEPGRIAAQTPLPGTLVEVRTTVSVFSAVPIVVTVPNLTGYSVEEARQILERHRLVLGGITEKESDENPNKIINQNPDADAKAGIGDTVSVTVGVKSEEIPVPNLIGKTVKQGAGILNQNGLAIGQISETDENRASGIILDQEPTEGVKVRPGSRVNITVQKQKHKLILSSNSAAIDSGESIKFTGTVIPDIDNIKYKFYFGDGSSSNWITERVFEYSYIKTGNFMPYVEARIAGENIIRSEPINLKIRSSETEKRSELLLILSLIGALIIISGSAFAYKRYIKADKEGNIITRSVDIRTFKDSGIQKIENEEALDLKFRISIRLLKNDLDSQINISGLK